MGTGVHLPQQKQKKIEMNRFYTRPENIREGQAWLDADACNHMKNVLRMQPGDEFVLCDGEGRTYLCSITSFASQSVVAKILDMSKEYHELPVKIVLYQGLPKKDKMELIIQKAVELGASEIVPVMTKRCVAKLEDPKKEARKLERWNAIAKSAAEQSRRDVIPVVRPVMSFADAIREMSSLSTGILPYEEAEDMKQTAEVLREAALGQSVGILIGPEGGLEGSEVQEAMALGIRPVTLGRRILRTETAGLVTLSMLMYEIELQEKK